MKFTNRRSDKWTDDEQKVIRDLIWQILTIHFLLERTHISGDKSNMF